MSRVLFAIILLCITGCSSPSSKTAERAAAPAAPRFSMPAPSELRGASFIPGERSVNGEQYETAFPNNRVQVSGTALQFAAGGDPTAYGDLAFAMYELDATGYTGQGLLGVDWQGAAPLDGVYIGLANWTANRWDWQLTPSTEEIDLGLYDKYVDSVSGHFLLIVLSTRTQTMTLDRIYFGTPGLEPPTNVMATDGTFQDHVEITWDPPVDGPFPAGYAIYRSDDILPRIYAQIGTTVGLTNYDDMTSLVDTVYWYKVKSTKAGDPDSALSGEDDGFATAGGFGWSINPAATFAVDPIYLSLALVNTKPAITYNKNSAGYPIYYAQAQTTAGNAWNAPVSQDDGYKEPCLGFFGGWPGYSFDGPAGGGHLWYRNGADADGVTWNSPVKVFNAASAHACSDPNLLMVNGNPAIAFRYSDFVGGTGTELAFIRANENAGNSWPATRVTVDSGESAWNPKLIILGNGFPAVLFSETDNMGSDPARIMYSRATNANGSAWAPAVKIYDLAGANSLPQIQIIIANGNPAAFISDDDDHLQYKRATSTDGSTWPLGATKVADAVDFYDGACTINGLPAFVYVDDGTDLKYVQALDSSGNSWLPPALVESVPGGLGLATMQAFGTVPNQYPAVAYTVDGVEVRYARKN